MAAQLTEKENYMRLMKGEIPEWVPRSLGMRCGVTISALNTRQDPNALEFTDLYGVPMIVEPNSGPIPKPGKYLLTDIRKWRDVIKRPKILDEINWEMAAQKDLADRDPALLKMGRSGIGNGYFMILTYFMGFDNALCAIVEEPEEVKALLNFILDINLEVTKNIIKYYKPDVGNMGDDIAHERAPFVSEETFLDIFEPMWRKNIEPYVDSGIPVEHHNCGAFEPFVPHIINMGFNAWTPAQPTNNDLPGIKAKFGRKLAIVGGFENNGMVSWADTTEEQIRGYVKQQMDTLAPNGGFALGGSVMGNPNDAVRNQRNTWIDDEYEKLKFSYYK